MKKRNIILKVSYCIFISYSKIVFSKSTSHIMAITKEEVYEMTKGSISIDQVMLKHKTSAHIAVVMKRNKILAVASNSVGSRSRGCGYAERTIHAERAVLKKIGDVRQLQGAILIVLRISRGLREIVNSEPCHSCKCHLEKCMKEYGLRNVYYSA